MLTSGINIGLWSPVYRINVSQNLSFGTEGKRIQVLRQKSQKLSIEIEEAKAERERLKEKAKSGTTGLIAASLLAVSAVLSQVPLPQSPLSEPQSIAPGPQGGEPSQLLLEDPIIEEQSPSILLTGEAEDPGQPH